MFLLRIANGSGNEGGKPSLPMVLPEIERKNFRRGGPKTVAAYRGHLRRALKELRTAMVAAAEEGPIHDGRH